MFHSWSPFLLISKSQEKVAKKEPSSGKEDRLSPRGRERAEGETRYREAEQRTGIESAITRLMGTRSGARVVKGRERDHATRLDSSKNGVTRKSMLVERTVGRRSEKRAVENRATKRSSPFARSPTTDPLPSPLTLFLPLLGEYSRHTSRIERYGRHERNETK